MAKELKEMPGWSQGVRENAAIRMVKMIRPICPHSQKEYYETPEGKVLERRNPGQEPNCQSRGGAWWEYCEAQGHNPYFRSRKWYEKIEVSNGDGTVDFKTVKHEGSPCSTCSGDHLIPNVKQISAHIRINSGRGPDVRHRAYGYRYLPEMGYAEVCEFRNCQKPVKVEGLYGKYCSTNHAALCATDALGSNLQYISPSGEFEQGKEIDLKMRRQRELREAAEASQVRKIR